MKIFYQSHKLLCSLLWLGTQYSGVTENCENVATLGEAVTELLHSQRIFSNQDAFLRHFE
jgi:hypothetical protein